MINKKTELEQITLRDCKSIGEMVDYIVEISFLYDNISSLIDTNLIKLKNSYRYFNEHEYNKCHTKLEELKRDVQIIRRKTDILEERLFDSTLPDNAMCFLFDQSLKKINRDILKLNTKFNYILDKITFKFFLIQN